MSPDLQRELVNGCHVILKTFFEKRDWVALYQQLREKIYFYQNNHSAIACLTKSFLSILQDVDFLQYFIVMEENNELQKQNYEYFLELFNDLSPLTTFYQLAEDLDINIDNIDHEERVLFTLLLKIFKTFALKNHFEEEIVCHQLFENLATKNPSEVQNIFGKVTAFLNNTECELFEPWQAFQALYPKMNRSHSTGFSQRIFGGNQDAQIPQKFNRQ